MDILRMGSTNLLELLGPTDEAAGAAISSPTSINCKLYDDAKDTSLSAAAAGAQADIVVDEPDLYAVDDVLAVRLDSGSDQELTIQAIAGSTITFTANLTGPAAAAARVARKLGATITISTTAFGTPAPNDESWGFRGFLPDDHADLVHRQLVRLEYDFDGGANLHQVSTDHAQVLAPWLGEPPI